MAFPKEGFVVPKSSDEGTSESGGDAKGRGAKKRKRKKSTVEKPRQEMAGMIDPELAVVIKDPLRVQILAIAIRRLISPKEFSKESGCSVGSASYHFRVLREKGFLELVKKVQVRGATKHMYRATRSGFISDNDWGQVTQAVRPRIASAIVQDFNARVDQAMDTGTLFSHDDACLYWVPVDLDEISWPKFVELIAWCIDKVEELTVETVQRRAEQKAKGSIPATFAIAGFESPTDRAVKKGQKATGKEKREKKAKQSGATKKKTKKTESKKRRG